MKKILVLILVSILLQIALSQPEDLQKGTKVVYYAEYRFGSRVEYSLVNFTVVSLNDYIEIEVSSKAKWMTWLTGLYKVSKEGIIIEGKYQGKHFPLWLSSLKPSIEILGKIYKFSGEEITDSEELAVYITNTSLISFRKKDLLMYSLLVPLNETDIANYRITLIFYEIEKPTIPLEQLMKKAIEILEYYSLLIALVVLAVSIVVKKTLFK